MEALLEQEPVAPSESSDTESIAGKYLTFMLDEEEYGVEILKIREIIGIMDITRVPQTQNFVQGVINLRGKVIPLVDLRAKFGLSRQEYNDQTCIIVVDVGTMMGIIVDTVSEVHDFLEEDIEPPPSLGSCVDTSFIRGMGKTRDGVKILLDIARVLHSEELVAC
ncbi:MAG: purine-binding chemotaxis protein CheW [Phycisphaerales bacterium]|nr:purine-binding chemotaxis protein CheW [Phycisphaerales bacterium]